MNSDCEYCNKTLKNIYSLKKHYNVCKVKKNLEIEKLKCNYCNKIFTSKSSLNNHQKTAKYCLDLQNKLNFLFECEFCKKKFSRKCVLTNHANICKAKKNKEEIIKEKKINNKIKILSEKVKVLEETLKEKEKEKDNLRLLVENLNYKTQEENYKEQIKDLQNKFDKIANKAIDRPTITNNTINNNKFLVNVFPSQTEIESKIESKFNDKYLHDGIKGVAQFVFDHIVKLEDGSIAYICFDISRQIFKYKDENGVEIKDPKAFKLKKMIKPGLLKQSQTLLDYFRDECEYMEKRKAQGLEIDNKEYKIMNTLREKAFEVGCEILSIEDTNKFNTELSNLTCI